jgi:hypothetical protein
MKPLIDESRRWFLHKFMLGAALIPLADLRIQNALAADAPLVTADDPAAKALNYTPDASKASGAKPGSKCASCAQYQGAAGSAEGGCLFLPGKQVKSAGWCSAWAPKTS